MTDDGSTWREFRARFGRDLTWRELVGFIRDDRVMKTRLVILVLMSLLSLSGVTTFATGHLAASAMCFVAMVVVGVVGSSA